MMNFLQGSLWNKLKQAALDCRQPAHVAVAYFGRGAAKLLRIPDGSRLVVDASEHAVKCGLTHPADLKTMVRQGVRVYCVENLHAKVFVLGRKVFVGSNNASHSSSHRLVEAAVVTTDPKTVSDAREFVQSLCLVELGPDTLDRLQKLYRAPKTDGNASSATASSRHTKPALPRTMMAQITIDDGPPEGSERLYESGQKKAAKRQDQPKKHVIDDFWQRGRCPYAVGDVVIQVVNDGQRRMVSPPGKIILTQRWRGPRREYTFVFMEMPRTRRIELNRLARRLGRGAKKRLTRDGRVQKEFAQKLLATWSPS